MNVSYFMNIFFKSMYRVQNGVSYLVFASAGTLTKCNHGICHHCATMLGLRVLMLKVASLIPLRNFLSEMLFVFPTFDICIAEKITRA